MTGQAAVRNLFLGLDADAWAEVADSGVLPYSDMAGSMLTLADVAKGLDAMLRRLDAENSGDAGARDATSEQVGPSSACTPFSPMNTDSGRRFKGDGGASPPTR